MMTSIGFLFMVTTFNEWKLMDAESKSLIYRGFWLCWFTIMLDSLLISMVTFATARIAVLGYKFENFEIYSNGRNESTFHCLRNIVTEHQNLIRYVEDVQKSLKWYLLGEFLIKSYHITVSLLNVIHATNKEEIIFYQSMVIGLLLHVSMFYYNANELSSESTNLSVRIFKSNWYDQSSGVVRSLSIVMARVQRPLVLYMGNIRVIDNDLIVNMIKAAYTFLLYQEI
ncbi:unnamed protein product [Phaedon cochleariae]|uniref:Odorant receptor n=1 Tax=Phaedon cochleariae TaxID=80249 RepID=A0A9N9SDB0_PHACE|nr:unnamed protein product [Phaedon cochleariae]